MRRADVPRVLSLWRDLMANGQRMDPRWDVKDDAHEWMAAWIRDVFLVSKPYPHAHVYEEDGEVQAFVSGFPDSGSPVLNEPPAMRIGDVYVAPSVRRRGVGRRLVDAQVQAAHRAGCTNIIVETLVKDERAVAFWRGIGFDPMRIQLRRAVHATDPT